MSKCAYCGKPLPPSRKKRKWCPSPAGCKQAWHRENTHPGIVTGLRQLRSGAWAVTVRYPSQPEARIGDRILLEMASQAATDPSPAVRDAEMPTGAESTVRRLVAD